MTVLIVLAFVLGLTSPGFAQPPDTVGVVTEIKPGRGRVEVKSSGAADWRPAGPLSALRAGDAIRATDDAVAVVLLAGGRGTRRIDAAASPVVLDTAGAGDSGSQKARTLVAQSLRFLSLTTKEAPKGVLATRGGAPPPIVLSPRQAFVRPAPLTFEWVGGARARYTVRLTGPAGIVFERDVVGGRLAYPDGAPALQPDAQYTIEVRTEGRAPQTATFQVLAAERARDIDRDLAELDAMLGPGAASSTAIARAGYLAERGLFHDAREIVVGALRNDPDQAALYLLLANIYDRTGLRAQAAEAYAEAEFLTMEKPR